MLAPDRRAQTNCRLEAVAAPVTLCTVHRPNLAALAVLAIALAVGCGSSSTKGSAPSPTLQTLSYLPSSSPFVLTVSTHPASPALRNAQALKQRFPAFALLQTAFFSRLAHLGLDYNKDIKPLYGNPFALGVLSTPPGASHAPFLAVWVTRSQSALATVVKRLGSGLRRTGTHDDATLYAAGSAALAIDGPTVLIARTAQDIDTALDRHEHGQGFTAAEYGRLTSGTGSGGLIRMFGDLTQELSMPRAAQAQRIPWVAALKGYGVSIGVAANGPTIQFHVDTSGRSLSSSQLPLAGGSASPGVAGSAPIQMGLRDLTQPIQFVEAAVKATDPARYARFTQHVATLKQRAGFDLNSFVSLLDGTLDISSDTRTTIARVAVSDPPAVAGMLRRLSSAPALAFFKRTQIHALGGGLYDLQEPSGLKLTMGVIGHELAIGKAAPAEIRAFAREPTTTVPGATGSVSFRVAVLELLHLALKQAPSPVSQQFLHLLGDVTGSVSATPSGLSGAARLALK